jgi:peptidoglycan hydrolase CwlO-like protein
LDSIEKEMRALKKVTKSTESKVDNLQKAVKELEGNFELIEADIANAEASIMDTIGECMGS